MTKTILPLLLFLTLLILLLPAPAWCFPFDQEQALSYLDTLCCPRFQGRKSGETSAALAEQWAADKFRQFGLQPIPGSRYLQTFPILCNREIKAELELLNGYHGRKKYVHGEDFHLITNSGSAKIKAEVVFVGYGIEEPSLGRDDFTGIDLKGKIALIYKEVPSEDRMWDEARWREYKANKAMQRGAIAVLFVMKEYAISGAAIDTQAFNPQVPMVLLSQNVAVDVFRGCGKNFEQTIEALKKSPQSFNTHKILRIQTKLQYNPSAVASNVIGLLPGSDSLLKDEYFIIGAHLDHNGVNASGDVFYGADDNASGASVVLELARNFAQLEPPPKRSIIFILFAGEEQGLLGSEYYVQYPVIPLEKAVGMFNFDCCGAGEGGVGFGGKEHYPQVWDAYAALQSPEDSKLLTLSTNWGYGSDNGPFERWWLPSFNFWSSGARYFYHQVEDLSQYISPPAIGNTGRISGEIIAFFANWDKPLLEYENRSRTVLFAASTVNIYPINYNDFTDEQTLIDSLKSLRHQGLKCSFAALESNNAFADYDRWRSFCLRNNFRFIEDGGQLNNAIRQEKFALFPVLTDINSLDNSGADLRNLCKLGLKTIAFLDLPQDSAKIPAVIEQAAGLDMAFIVPQDGFAVKYIPSSTRQIVILPPGGALESDSAKTRCRYVFSADFSEIEFTSSSMMRRYHLNPYWSCPQKILETRLYITSLEKRGLKRQDIKYLLGDNLLEILEW